MNILFTARIRLLICLVRTCFQWHSLRLCKIARMLSGTFPSIIKITCMLSGTFPSFIKDQQQGCLTLCILETPNSTLANIEHPNEMQHNAAFHQGLHCLPNYAAFRQGLHCLLKLKHSSVAVIHFNLENSYCFVCLFCCFTSQATAIRSWRDGQFT